MAFEIKKAVRSGVKVKIALMGGAGSGKTLTALKMARGIVGPSGKILHFDSENRRAESYADTNDFDTAALTAPYKPELYIEAINAAVAGGYDCCILDSITPEWDGKGGILEEKELLDRRGGGNGGGGGRGGNGFVNWAVLTPRHQSFVEAIVQAPIHLICTVRAKQEYAMGVGSTGRNTVEKLGVKPIQREGIEYEFHLALLLDQSHQPVLPPVKDTTGLFESFTGVIDYREGEAIGRWANSGEPFVAAPVAPVAPASTPSAAKSAVRLAAEVLDVTAESFGFLAAQVDGAFVPSEAIKFAKFLKGDGFDSKSVEAWVAAKNAVEPFAQFVYAAIDTGMKIAPEGDFARLSIPDVRALVIEIFGMDTEGPWPSIDWGVALIALRKMIEKRDAPPVPPAGAAAAPSAPIQRTTTEPTPKDEEFDDLTDPFAE